MVETTTWPWTIDHDAPDAGSTLAILEPKKLGSAGADFDMKRVRRTKVEQIRRIIIVPVSCILVIEFHHPTPNQKGNAGEHSTKSETWTGNISTGLQERVAEKSRVDITYRVSEPCTKPPKRYNSPAAVAIVKSA
jgi:hypothetical protein